jgi:hypothetical protein
MAATMMGRPPLLLCLLLVVVVLLMVVVMLICTQPAGQALREYLGRQAGVDMSGGSARSQMEVVATFS